MAETKFQENFVSGENQYVRKSDKEIRQMAVDYFGGNLFGSWGFRNEGDRQRMMTVVFMPLTFLNEVQKKTLLRDEAEHVYGYMKDSSTMGINGYPIFYSIQIINKEDFSRFVKACDLLKEFMGEEIDAN